MFQINFLLFKWRVSIDFFMKFPNFFAGNVFLSGTIIFALGLFTNVFVTAEKWDIYFTKSRCSYQLKYVHKLFASITVNKQKLA